MLIEPIPKISCVTVTTGRVEMVKQAISCFVSQTYKHKEMIIVSQGTMEQNERIREISASNEIVFVEAPKDLSLGALRNVSIELTTGDIICQWDDDDLYHPDRLMTQYRHLRCGGIACLYTQHLKLFKNSGTMYWVDQKRGTEDYLEVIKSVPYKKFLAGSIMFRKSCFHNCKNALYPEHGGQCDKEEDLNVLQKLMKIGKVNEVSEGHQYVYVHHGNNVYELNHHKMGLHKKYLFSKSELEERRDILEETFKSVGVSGFDVCGSPIVDFDDTDAVLGKDLAFTVS